MTELDPELQHRNLLVLYVVQALVGAITPNFIAVSVRFEHDRFVVEFWLHAHAEQAEEDIAEIIADIDAYMGEEVYPLVSEVHIGPPPTRYPTREHRMVFRVKP